MVWKPHGLLKKILRVFIDVKIVKIRISVVVVDKMPSVPVLKIMQCSTIIFNRTRSGVVILRWQLWSNNKIMGTKRWRRWQDQFSTKERPAKDIVELETQLTKESRAASHTLWTYIIRKEAARILKTWQTGRHHRILRILEESVESQESPFRTSQNLERIQWFH